MQKSVEELVLEGYHCFNHDKFERFISYVVDYDEDTMDRDDLEDIAYNLNDAFYWRMSPHGEAFWGDLSTACDDHNWDIVSRVMDQLRTEFIRTTSYDDSRFIDDSLDE